MWPDRHFSNVHYAAGLRDWSKLGSSRNQGRIMVPPGPEASKRLRALSHSPFLPSPSLHLPFLSPSPSPDNGGSVWGDMSPHNGVWAEPQRQPQTKFCAFWLKFDCYRESSSVKTVADRHRLPAYHSKHCRRAFQWYQHRWPWTTLNPQQWWAQTFYFKFNFN